MKESNRDDEPSRISRASNFSLYPSAFILSPCLYSTCRSTWLLRSAATRPLEIIETAPPREPRHYTPVWGVWRVVRERELENGALQLTVARELLQEISHESRPKTR